MKIIFVNGSPRCKGNSDTVIQYLERYCMENHIEYNELRLREKSINSCLGCNLCHQKAKQCSHNDDFSNEIFDIILDADAIMIVSPVYQGSVTGIMKNFMDRCEMFRKGRLLKNKLCGGVAIGGYSGGGQELTLMQIQYFAHICAMRYIASWGKVRSHLGGYCVAHEKQEVENDKDGLSSCENVIAEIVNCFSSIKIDL